MNPFQTMITPVVIAALAVTGLSAAPAKAENSDLAKLLIGLGAVAVIASAIDKNKKANAATVTTSRNGQVYDTHDWQRRDDRPSYRMSHALPANCLRTYDARHGTRELFSGSCLDRVNYRLAELPRACGIPVVERNRKRDTAYAPQCLARYGFRQIDMREKPRGWEYDRREGWSNDRRDDDRSNDRHISWGN